MAKHTSTIAPNKLAAQVTGSNPYSAAKIISTPTPVATASKPAVVNEVSTTSPVTKKVKLANAKTDIITPISRTTVEPQEVTKVKSLMDNYVAYHTNKSIRKNGKDNITMLSAIMLYVYEHQTDEVLNTTYSFFRSYRKSYLSPEVALQGIEKLNSTSSKQERVQQTYTLFYHISASLGKVKRLDLEYAGKVLGTGNLLNYMSKHMV